MHSGAHSGHILFRPVNSVRISRNSDGMHNLAQEAMLVARFLVKDSNNNVMQRNVMKRLPGISKSSMTTLHPPRPISIICASELPLISLLAGDNSLPIIDCIQSPKSKLQRIMTASALH